MIALAKSLVLTLSLLLFVSAEAARAQNWNQGNYQQTPQNQYQFGDQNQFGSQNQYQYGNQMQSQMQGQMQNQGAYQGSQQYGNPMQMQNTYYGEAQQSQPLSNQNSQAFSNSNGTTGGFSSTQYDNSYDAQSSAPGTFIESGNQTDLSGGSAVNDTPSSTSSGGGSKLKSATGTIGNILGKSLKVAAPVAGAYMLNKAAQSNGGYYQPNPYYGGYNNSYGSPYYGSPYGAANPYYGGYGYGYPAQNPYYGGGYGTPYYPQQSTGNTILNTGLRALFGY